jgi:hypothetical protein
MKNSNYIENIFHKNKDQLTLDDLKEFFSSPQEETSVLEFKSGGVEIIDIYKEVAAFLNTEGGLLVIGAPKEQKKKTGRNEIFISQGELTFSKFKNKDWIYQKIASNIIPSPTYIRIKEFVTEKGGVYLIDIPQSMNPPHQCSADGRYYIRLEREAKPAPHGIVQALFNKRKLPKLFSEISLKSINISWHDIHINFKNDSSIPAEKTTLMIDLYNVAQVKGDDEFSFTEYNVIGKFSTTIDINRLLARVVSVPIKFRLQHKGSKYLLILHYWCKDVDYDFEFVVFNPQNDQILYSDSFKNKRDAISEVLKEIEQQEREQNKNS